MKNLKIKDRIRTNLDVLTYDKVNKYSYSTWGVWDYFLNQNTNILALKNLVKDKLR